VGFKGAASEWQLRILAGPLVGEAFCAIEGEWGNTIIALDPGLLVDGERFKDASAMSGMVPPRCTAHLVSKEPGVAEPSEADGAAADCAAVKGAAAPRRAHLDDGPVALHPDLQGGVIEIQRGPMFVTRRQGFKDSPAPAHGVPPAPR